MKINNPLIALVIAAASIGSVLIAAFIEPFASMNPCPMCMMQRALYLAVGVFAILTLITVKHTITKSIFASIGLICATIGTAVAGRQVWLQHLPAEEVPACGPPLEYMLEVFPLLEVVQHALMGTGDCAEVQWQWLGLSIPGWSIVLFLGLALGNILILFRRG